jgi:hypothetical protein
MTPLAKATRPRLLDNVEHTADYLRAVGLLPDGPVPVQRLGAGADAPVRFADLVVKHADARQRGLVTELGPLLPGVGPEIVCTDDDSELLITRFVPGAQWERQLESGRIDARTFAAAGALIRSVHLSSISGPHMQRRQLEWIDGAREPGLIGVLERVDARLRDADPVLLHGACEPGNVIVAAPQRLVLTGWASAGYGPAALDIARLLACLIAYTAEQPFTEDWYIDAGRAFLDSYGYIDPAVLRPLVGLELLAAKSDAVHRVLADNSVRQLLRKQAFALLLDDDPLPW